MDEQSIEEPTSDATAIKSTVRGDDARCVALEQSLVDKNRAIDELHETVGAFKLLNEKQTAELNAKDLLLARKNERIDELVQQLKERDTQIQSRGRSVAQLQVKTQELDEEIRELKNQLATEEDEFAMLSTAMETKDQQLRKKTDEITSLRDTEVKLHKEIDRLQVQMRKLEKHVSDLQPETMDACLSPRSFSEHQLIQLRDDAIQAKTKEIWILTGKNDQLRIQLDELEAELERLQTSYVSKENDLARRDRKIEKLENELEGLHVARQQAEGRERAIEIATTQNTKLLQALQALEVQGAELTVRCEQAEKECMQLRQTHRENLAKSAVNEVEVLHKSKEVEHKSSLLSTLQDKLTRERKSLHEEITNERMRSQLEIEKLQSELVMRRNKQYELTLRLQEVETKLHDTNDECERAREQLQVTKLRMEEAERVLQDALLWKRALEDELRACREDGDQKQREWAKQLSGSQAEIATLRGQLHALKESLLQSLDDAKKKDFRVHELMRSGDAKEQVVTEQKERIARLVQEISKGGQARAEVELEKKLLSEQLERIKQQMGDAIRECMDQQRRIEEKCQREHAKLQEMERERASEQRGRAKLLRLFVHAYGGFAGVSASKWVVPPCLDLRECSLTDQDIAPICTMLETNAALREGLTRVDLRSNRVTQDGTRAIVRYLRQCLQPSSPSSYPAPIACVREIDLRGNFISIEGIRMVANALESVASSDHARVLPFIKVFVVNGGRIECYPDGVVSNNEIPVLTIDITENGDPDTVLLPPKQLDRRKRDQGGVPTASTKSSSTADPVLQAIYGLDLVSAFMGDAKVMPPGPTSSRTRRKSTEKNRSESLTTHESSTLLPSFSTLVEAPASHPSNLPQSTISPRLLNTNPDARDSTRAPCLRSSASLPRL
jgi:hypothetical protein